MDYQKRKNKAEKDFIRMVKRYDLKFGSSCPLATERYATGVRDYVLLEPEIREIIDRHGVSIIYYATYLNFARQVYKRMKERRSHEIEAIIEDAVNKKGLNREVLKEIYNKCREVREKMDR